MSRIVSSRRRGVDAEPSSMLWHVSFMSMARGEHCTPRALPFRCTISCFDSPCPGFEANRRSPSQLTARTTVLGVFLCPADWMAHRWTASDGETWIYFVGRMGVKRPEMGSKWRFFGESATWLITAQLLSQDTVKSKVASHESQERNRRKFIPYINLR